MKSETASLFIKTLQKIYEKSKIEKTLLKAAIKFFSFFFHTHTTHTELRKLHTE